MCLIWKLLVVVYFLSANFALGAGAFDFKGIAIGEPSTAADVEEKLGIRCGSGLRGAIVCNGYTTIGGESAQGHVMIDEGGRVARLRVSFSARTFDSVEQGLLEKYGVPRTNKKLSQTRSGVTVESVTHIWITPLSAVITLSKNISTAGDAMLLMRNSDLVERERAKASENKRDF